VGKEYLKIKVGAHRDAPLLLFSNIPSPLFVFSF